MTDAAHPEPGHGAATPSLPFAEADWQTLQKDDRQAAAAVVGLMAGIFSIGLVLYLIVAIWVGVQTT
jgi:hypothetical protein